MKSWRTKKRCDNCPFADKGRGVTLRKSLGRTRWKIILDCLRRDGYFPCHKTTEFDDDGEVDPVSSFLLCAGALQWQERNIGHVGQMARIMERIHGCGKQDSGVRRKRR
jgi:hypothetical protein